ncbi:hypothetical protein STXM2123_3552 [Streptomyces sp. F-3]|nr:hypothetical protein STXM2123_3552 [Streptomyces sp. F-3]
MGRGSPHPVHLAEERFVRGPAGTHGAHAGHTDAVAIL